MTQDLAIEAIAPDVADELRRGRCVPVTADAKPGYPCRQCLRDAEIGDEMLLVSHNPFDTSSPYAAPTPILLHTRSCRPYESSGTVPDLLIRRTLSLRLYDQRGMLQGSAVIEGDGIVETVGALLSDHPRGEVHVHNAGPGCWNCTIRKRTN